MIEGTTRVKVFNECKYNIGLTLTTGIQILIRPGSFQFMTVDDILFIESTYPHKKLFSGKKLVAKDTTNKPVDLSEYLYGVAPDEEHKTDDEIISILKQNPKKIEAWLENITEESELHNIYLVAKDQDLPASKLKVLAAKIQDKDWLDSMI